MPRLRIHVVVAALLCAWLGTSACRHERPALVFPGAPVILISIDTLRADHLPAYGYAAVATPHFDSFRADATLFRNASSAAPLTLPSHLTMLTGLLPPEHGVRDNVGFRFDAKAHATIPSLLHDAGYATGAMVSSYVLHGDSGLAQAFDFYDDAIDPGSGDDFREFQRSGAITEKLAESWVDRQQSKPFFLFFHIYEPHVPYEPPEPFRTRYAANPYDGEIATADAIVGELLDHLKRLGIYDRALIILTSDHGEGLGDHGEAQHSVLVYRETIHVPLMIKLPRGAHAPSEVGEPVSLADLMTTVATLTGVKNIPKSSGLPLFGALPAHRAIYSESLYARLHFGWSALRSLTDDRRQFIESPRSELYDLVADPGEKHDLAQSDRRTLGSFVQQMTSYPASEATPTAVSTEEKARLASLGYVAAPAGSETAAINPADRIGELEELQRASQLAARGNVSEGIALLHAITAKHPAMVEAWIQLGEVQARSSDFADAIEAYRTAVARSPHPSDDTLLALGDAYLQARDYVHAKECAAAAVAAAPDAAHALLARIAMFAGDFVQAGRELATIERPRLADLVLGAEIEQREGHHAEALAMLDKLEAQAATSHEPVVYRLEFLRGDTYARMNRTAEAITHFDKELAAFPNELAAYAALALVQAVAGDRRGANNALERMLRANPTPAARRLAAQTRQELGL